MLLKLLYPALTAIAIFGAQVVDEHFTVPLFTTVSICCSLLYFTISVTRKMQMFIDRLGTVEKGHRELKTDLDQVRKDMALKSDIASIQSNISEMKATMAELRSSTAGLKSEVREFRNDRTVDMDRLRDQLRSDAMLKPVSEETGMRILMVDDNDQDIALFRRRVSPTFILDSAPSLAKANSMIQKEAYDAVFLDLKLPDARHNRTVEDFKADNPGVLVIVLTGSNDEATTKRCFEQGADGVWVKGVDDRDVRTIVRRLKEAIWRRSTVENPAT